MDRLFWKWCKTILFYFDAPKITVVLNTFMNRQQKEILFFSLFLIFLSNT